MLTFYSGYWAETSFKCLWLGVLSVCLSTDINSFNLSGRTGQTLTSSCDYPNGAPILKFFCKGEDPSTCESLTSWANNTRSRFSIKDDSVRRKITITVRNTMTADSGTYWCGAKRVSQEDRNRFFCRIFMSVGEYWHPTGLLGLLANATRDKTFF